MNLFVYTEDVVSVGFVIDGERRRFLAYCLSDRSSDVYRLAADQEEFVNHVSDFCRELEEAEVRWNVL